MTTFVDHRDAKYTEHVNARGAEQRQFDYFGKTSPHQFGPEAFLVDYGPTRTTTAHFHSVDQFQVFFGAPGARYQRHPIPAVELHYADAFVTYGPFSAGEERIKFFTLRSCQGQYKGEMPAERHKLRYQGRRGIHVNIESQVALESTTGDVVVTSVIEPHDDGLSAVLVVAGPATEIGYAPAGANSGSFLCVLAGEITDGDRVVGPFSLGWMAADDVGAPLTTGPVGAAVLRLTYPFPPTPVSHGVDVTPS